VKVFHSLYSQITSVENLFQAWEEFKKGKLRKLDVGRFERNLEDNLFSIYKELMEKTYKHNPYIGFYITDPKQRHIHKAEVRDRIVHHALFKVLNPLFDNTFISDSYSCRKGYGTHKGFKKLVIYARKVSKNYTRNCWALKCDIKKFFDSVDHDILLRIIKGKIEDENTLWLLEEIIQSYEAENKDCHPSFAMTGNRRGIPIGNLTSQLFANIYLNELDQYIKHKLKVKYYLRYADDFILLSSSKELLETYLCEIEQFLQEKLKLSLHPRKTVFKKLSWGIDFVGYIALPHYEVLRTKTKRRIFKQIKKKIELYKSGNITKQEFEQSHASYFGILTHANTYKIKKELRKLLAVLLTK